MTPAEHAFYTDQHRLECETRHVLGFPTREARRQYLDMVEKKRGEPARRILEREIMKQWKEKQN